LSAIQPHAPDVDAARTHYDLGKSAMGGDDVAFLPKLPMIISHFAETIAYAPNNEGEMRFDGLYQMSIALAYFERYQSEGKPGYLTGDAFPCALEYLSAANELADQATKDRLLTKNHGQLVVYSQTDPCQGLALLDKVDRTQVPYDAIDFYRGLAFEQLHNWDKAEAAFNLIKNSTSSDGEVDDIKRTQLPGALARVASHPETPPPTPCPPSP
jgi:hypothetical protein